MLREIVTYPEKLVDKRLDSRGISREAVFVLVIGLLGAAGYAYVSIKTLNVIDDNAQLRFELIGITVRQVLAAFAAWAGFGIAGHILAGQFRGRGPVIRVVRAAAWSLVPVGIWYAIRSIAIGALFLGVEIPPDPEGLGAEEKLQTILELGLENPVYYVVVALGLVAVAWSWRLFAHGVAEAKEITESDARKVAAVPAAIYALLILQNLLTSMGVL